MRRSSTIPDACYALDLFAPAKQCGIQRAAKTGAGGTTAVRRFLADTFALVVFSTIGGAFVELASAGLTLGADHRYSPGRHSGHPPCGAALRHLPGLAFQAGKRRLGRPTESDDHRYFSQRISGAGLFCSVGAERSHGRPDRHGRRFSHARHRRLGQTLRPFSGLAQAAFPCSLRAVT